VKKVTGSLGSKEAAQFTTTWRKPMIAAIVRFMKTDEGVTAIEYGLIAALIGIAAIAAMTLVGTNLTAKFNAVATALQ
jgi:pilus assembly protein Flp/PilA